MAPNDLSASPGCTNGFGFSLHAATCCATHQRTELERLCRYITRPPIANERLQIDPDDGQVILALKTPYRDGTSEIKFTPLEFLGRLAALVPRPWINLIRYHGLVAPNSKWRKAIVPQPPDIPPNQASSTHSTWASLLKRVFKIDVLTCAQCQSPLRIISVITDPQVISRILNHLGLATRAPPRWPSRVALAN